MRIIYCKLFCLLMFFWTSGTIAETPEITAGISVPLIAVEHFPWTESIKAQQSPFIELVKAAFAQQGIAATVTYMPRKHGQRALAKGTHFAIFPRLHENPGRHPENFSDAVVTTRDKLYYNTAYLNIPAAAESLKELQQYHVVGLHGATSHKLLQQAGLKVDFVGSELQQLQQIAAGRFDLAPINSALAEKLILNHFRQNNALFATLKRSLRQTSLHLQISATYEGHERLLEQFNNGLRVIKENGVLKQILHRYRIIANKEDPPALLFE